MQKHPAYRLTYALNEKGQLVGVNSVPAGNKCGCLCPACKEPLTAKNQGIKRTHHFAHQSGTECAYAVESMLHILAKEKIREAFLSKSGFWIDFEYQSFCANFNECKYLRQNDCCESKRQRFNLKRFYDSCEQERPYDNVNRRSDLKIYSSTNPERSPIYLEFFVTHASGQEKLHSGNKIIEIRIESEEDILQLVENGIVESDSCNSEGFNHLEGDSQKIRFYGFKKKDYKNNRISDKIKFYRYILHQSGKMQFRPEVCDCKKLAKSRASSLLEICVHTSDSFDLYKQILYICFQKFKIPNCILCKNYVDNYSGMGKICRLYKHLQIPCDEEFDTARAKSCPCFATDQEGMRQAMKNGLNEPYTVFTDNRI